MQNRGFALFPDGMMLGTAGEVQVGNANGVRHILRFGSIDLELGAARSAMAKSRTPSGGEGEKKAQSGRQRQPLFAGHGTIRPDALFKSPS